MTRYQRLSTLVAEMAEAEVRRGLTIGLEPGVALSRAVSQMETYLNAMRFKAFDKARQIAGDVEPIYEEN